MDQLKVGGLVKVSEEINLKLDHIFPDKARVLGIEKLEATQELAVKLETTRPFWLDEIMNLPMMYAWIHSSHLTKVEGN